MQIIYLNSADLLNNPVIPQSWNSSIPHQVDKLEQSENVRSEEEEKAVEQPIVFGESHYITLGIGWCSQ